MGVIKVRLKIFSGVRDPEWIIENSDDQKRIIDFLAAAEDRLKELQRQQRQKPSTRSEIPLSALPSTGYRGFEVTVDGKTHRVFQDALVNMAAATEQIERSLPETIDQFLFSTYADELMKRYELPPTVVRAQVGGPHPIAGLPATCDTSPLEIGHTTYRPPLWVGEPFCDNTCYGYAANVRTEDIVVPDDSTRELWSPQNLIDALAEDGLGDAIDQVPTGPPDAHGSHYVVALLQVFGGTKGSFHFLRLDRSGCWSHKVGNEAVTQRDDRNPKVKMTDLCSARFGSEFTFVGFFVVTSAVQDLLRERGQ